MDFLRHNSGVQWAAGRQVAFAAAKPDPSWFRGQDALTAAPPRTAFLIPFERPSYASKNPFRHMHAATAASAAAMRRLFDG